MDTYSPELARLLAGAHCARASDVEALRDEEQREQEAALEELAERVSAARSVV